jgi:hypothetical protein
MTFYEGLIGGPKGNKGGSQRKNQGSKGIFWDIFQDKIIPSKNAYSD